MSKSLLAIDPGNEFSGVAIIDENDYFPMFVTKLDNESILLELSDWVYRWNIDECVIEMVGHYGTGMAAGKTVFDTAVWIGRFWQKVSSFGIGVQTMLRASVKVATCGKVTANDSNVIRALADRFAPNEKNFGKGTKADPGWFYGFKADIWQAYALGVAFLDAKHSG